jgi:biotin-(acetyl-CoA carboxylase) ligase
MPLEQRSRTRANDAPALVLPPPFRPLRLREVGDAFAQARANAEELGAGALVFVGRFDLAEFAVVLEPEEPFALARRTAFYAGMVALADALSAIAPPEKPITITWPGTIRVDGGIVGGGRLGWPDDAAEQEPPAWLVFGAMIRTVSMAGKEAGLRPLVTALEEEGFDDAGSERLVEGFARHLMVATDRWQEGGFTPIAREYISRLERSGGRPVIEANGDLTVVRSDKTRERRALLPALSEPAWRDPVTGGPHA